MSKKIKFVLCLQLIFLFVFGQTVSAANYVPSITYKPAPPIVEVDKKQDIPIYGKDGKVTGNIPWGDIVVTPISQIDSAEYEDIKQNFSEAIKKISGKSLFTLCPELQTQVEKTAPELSEHQLVVKDLFHLAVYGTCKEYLETPGNHIYLTFKVDVAEDAPFYVMFCSDGGEWVLIKPEYVVRNGDGTVTIRFDEMGSVAFITGQTPLASVDPNNPEYTSPQTGQKEMPVWHSLIPILFIFGLLLTMGAVIKKQNKGVRNEE